MTFEEKLYSRIQTKINEKLVKYTVQLFFKNEKDKGIDAVGSGVLIKLENKFFIFSAAHCFKSFSFNNIRIPISGSFSNVNGELFSLDVNANSDSEYVDAAVIHLSNEFAEFISKEYEFYEINSFNFELPVAPQSNLMIFLFGFPLNKTKRKYKSYLINRSEWTLSTRTSLYNRKRTQSELNIRIFAEYNYKRLRLNQKFSTDPKEIRGLSGSGIWTIPRLSPDLSKIEVSLLGILIEQDHSKREIIGTRLNFFTGIIRKKVDQNVAKSKLIEINLK